jgi:hypothetical protein
MVTDMKSLEREKKQLREERDRIKAEAIRGDTSSSSNVIDRY